MKGEKMKNIDKLEEMSKKKLLTVQEVCDYLGIGQTKARELLRGRNGFALQIGNRWYADREKLDSWINRQAS